MSVTIEFQFSLKQRVKVVEINRPATVVELIMSDGGAVYKVVYWESCKRCSECCFAEELAAL